MESIVAPRRPTRTIVLGGLPIGGDAPVAVQSMTNTPTADVEATVEQVRRLESAGCEIVRVAVVDMDAARAITRIKDAIGIALVADIHFDYRLALAAAEAGADGLRINPGNIGGPSRVARVVDCARAHKVPIRIGVNAGSLDKDLRERFGGASAEAMVASALRQVEMLERLGFDQIKISLKASDVARTVRAYRLLAGRCDYPFHLGVTEAGGLIAGTVKSAIGIGMLLAEGIGDTIRVSLTRDPVEEVRTAHEILRALGIRRFGPEIISCPTCGRCEIDLMAVVEQVEKALLTCRLPIKVAVMGCVVNGPGEAREADVGLAGGRGLGILFAKGKLLGKVSEQNMVAALLRQIDGWAAKYQAEDDRGEDGQATERNRSQ